MSFKRAHNRFLGIRDFPYLKLGKPSGFDVLKQNRVKIWDWKYVREEGYQNYPLGLRD